MIVTTYNDTQLVRHDEEFLSVMKGELEWGLASKISSFTNQEISEEEMDEQKGPFDPYDPNKQDFGSKFIFALAVHT